MFATEKLASLRNALADFHNNPLREAGTALLAALGYRSDKTADFGNTPEHFIAALSEATHSPVNRDKAQVSRWQQCAFLFQLTDDEIPSLARGQQILLADPQLARHRIESFVFLALELQGEHWSRTELAAMVRELNRCFPMPAIVLFKHGNLLSLAVIDRRVHQHDSSRDVLDSRITLIKDVRTAHPHRAHLAILAGLALENLGEKHRPTDFRALYDAWIAALSTQALNKQFYQELADWYFWAVKQVDFPPGGGQDEAKRNAVAVIRLLTRLIFAWFIKEKGLIPEALFDPVQLKTLLKADPLANGESSTYYLAILQNLFFASLNVEMGADRKWAADGGGMKGDRLIHSLYRHPELFHDPDQALKEIFSKIPFLNGGLFECLDRELSEADFQRNPELKSLATKEGNGYVLRVDGFSRRKDAQPKVPNKLFFGGETQADLNADLGTKGKRVDVHGLLDIFARYKFTVEENTPVEEEVALDPELLGKVFENLLASYNADTQATARKQSGSFYTPREVVDYMVDEALIAYFERALLPSPASDLTHGNIGLRDETANPTYNTAPGECDLPPVGRVSPSGRNPTNDDSTHSNVGLRDETANPSDNFDSKLRSLLSYRSENSGFSLDETSRLITAIEQLKILDPACGSGAYPMGVLNKLVHILRKLDPDNQGWKAQNRASLTAQLAEAKKIRDPSLHESRLEEAENALAKFDRDFANAQHADYPRKLYLIEKCIHGVDIQPIAVQIAKLRFFIALIVSQEVDQHKDNWGITALPNLETKIVAADSLMPIREVKSGLTENYALGHERIKAIEAELHDVSGRYFSARTSKTKRKYRETIQNLRDTLADELEHSGFSTAKAQQLVHWNPFDQNAAADFFDPEWMFQLANGFDVVIGNPPYVRQEEIKPLKNGLKAHYDCYTGTADLYVYFYERSIKLLKAHGAFAFITANKWYRAKYGEKLRDWMNAHTRLRRIIDFGDAAVFTAIAYPTIVIATRRPLPLCPSPASGRVGEAGGVNSEEVLVLNWTQQHSVEQFPQIFAQAAFPVPQAELSRNGWQLEPPLKRRLLERIRAAGKPLGEYVNGRFYYGIKTGFNEAFVIDGATRARLIGEDPKSAEIIKPFLRGRDVKRWRVEAKDLWLIFTRRPFAIEQYPAILAHLTQFKTQLMPKPDDWDDKRDGTWPGRKAGSYQWYEIQDNIAYWQEFEQTKIVVPAITDAVNYAPDTTGFYSNDKTSIVVSEEWRYLLAVLNSSLSWWLTQQYFASKQGGFFEFKPMYVSQVSIPNADDSQKITISCLVNAILSSADYVPRFEQLINGLVFELFFPDDLHRAHIRLFDACEQAGIAQLAALKGQALNDAAHDLAARLFAPDHPLTALLFNLQALDVVRLIEGLE